MDLKTPLYDTHVKLGGKIVPFGGYMLPVEYETGMLKEHMAVRQAAGLFDVSHMGEIFIEGKGALDSLNVIMTNDFTNLKIGRVRYTLMCNDDGGIVDDLIVYRLAEDRFMLVVNAANTAKDDAHIRVHLLPDTEMHNRSESIGLLALQGPQSAAILYKLADQETIPTGYYSFREHVLVGGIECLVSRTGYTGEYGYEFYCTSDEVVKLWHKLMDAGSEFGLIPCGLGARDTLRLEASMPLYGHEMNESLSPLEAGLDFAVKMNKDFIGKDAIIKKGVPRKRVGMRVEGRGIIRENQDVYLGEKKIGVTTSGTYLAYLKGAYAMAYVETGTVEQGDQVEVDVRGRRIKAEIVPFPFYKSE
ncbi:MAG: glycine cleavage system aminomethyltransferase GcvT [Saccharofermentanales bacterium]|jgi:aminomethyltransferase